MLDLLSLNELVQYSLDVIRRQLVLVSLMYETIGCVDEQALELILSQNIIKLQTTDNQV